jgi:hypothetical protein
MWSGTVGPFCSEVCRNRQGDKLIWLRANLYAARVVDGLSEIAPPSPIESADVARAFVLGYAAGLEDGHGAVGRRTVKK